MTILRPTITSYLKSSGHLSERFALRPSSTRCLRFKSQLSASQTNSQSQIHISNGLHKHEQTGDDLYDGEYTPIVHPDHGIKGTSHIIRRTVPSHIRYPSYSPRPDPTSTPEAVIPLGGKEEANVRAGGVLAASALSFISTRIRPGITTDELDEMLHKWIIGHDVYPSPLNYEGFPKSCCVSVNNVIAHGIPDSRKLEETDMFTLDLTLFTSHGYHSDTAATFLLPSCDNLAHALAHVTRTALEKAISVCGPGVPFSEIGRAIQTFVERESNGKMSVVPELMGHGISKVFHQRPWVSHLSNDDSNKMRPGHCFTIEPAIVASPDPSIAIFLDGWTIVATTGARAAQAEHTILITEDGADILTQRTSKMPFEV